MPSIEQCKRILESNEKKYSDKQVKAIRQILYQLAEIDYNNYKENLKHVKKSGSLYQSFN